MARRSLFAIAEDSFPSLDHCSGKVALLDFQSSHARWPSFLGMMRHIKKSRCSARRWATVCRTAISLAVACTVSISYAGTPAAGDWAAYNKTYTGERYSSLAQIDKSSVARLGRVCQAKLGDAGTFQSGPVVIGNRMYVTTTHTTVALDPATCEIVWQHVYKPEENEVYQVNRGVAVSDDRVFRGTADGRVLALDAKTGKELWRVKAANPLVGEFFDAAPLVWNRLLFLGTSGGDWAIRSRMYAFDTVTGAEKWRFNVVPLAGEEGSETWQAKPGTVYGGGGIWTSFALDEQTGELFVPTANPSPSFIPEDRPGNNLYTDSILVLDAKTGKRRWHFQHTPADALDNGTTAPALYDIDGKPRLAFGTKGGYVYVLDRNTHSVLARTAVTTVMEPLPKPSTSGVRVCPGFVGGMEWNGPALDPTSRTLFAGSVDLCNVVRKAREPYVPGRLYHGTMAELSTDPRDFAGRGWIVALDAENGAVKWRYASDSPVVAAVTPTAGGLVLSGTVAGVFLALDAQTGKELFRDATDGAIGGGVVTYLQSNRQYIAYMSGNVSRGPFFSVVGEPTITVLALDAQSRAMRTTHAPVDATPAPQGSLLSSHYRTYVGQKIYLQMCASCHGGEGQGGTGPALKGTTAKTRRDPRPLADIIKAPRSAVMPRFYPKALGDDEVRQLVEYLDTLK